MENVILMKTQLSRPSQSDPNNTYITHQAAFASQNLEDLAIYDAAGDQCCECGKSMTLAGHYVAYLCCTKCRYV